MFAFSEFKKREELQQDAKNNEDLQQDAKKG